MKKLDLSTFSSKELLKLKEQIEGEITKRAEKDKAIEEVKKLVSSKGISLDDLLSEMGGSIKAKKSSSRGVVPIKYKHPKDPSKTWTGRGKQPIWFKEALAAGITEKQLTVK